MLEHTAIFEFIDVRCIVLVFLSADAALTAIACEIAFAVRELLHRNQAFVTAFSAAVGAGLRLKCPELVHTEEGRTLRPHLKREDRRAVCAHEPRNIRTNNILAEDVLKCAQNCVVVERSALHDDVISKARYILDLHDLEQRILDDRERNACRDVGNLRPLLLRLLDLRVHKDRAARAEIDGGLCVHSFLRKLRRGHVKPLGKVLDE